MKKEGMDVYVTTEYTRNKKKPTFNMVAKNIMVSGLAIATLLSSFATPVAAQEVDAITKAAPTVSQSYQRSPNAIQEVQSVVEGLKAQIKRGILEQQDLDKLAIELSALNRDIGNNVVDHIQEIRDIYNDSIVIVNNMNKLSNLNTTKVDAQVTILGSKLTPEVDAISGVAPKITKEEFEAEKLKPKVEVDAVTGRQMKRVETPSRSGVRKITFSDVKPGAWYKDTVDALVAKGGIGGYEDGTFRPNNSISFAEFLKMSLNSATGKDYAAIDGGHWASGVHKAAIEQGIISGVEYPGIATTLNKEITREDMAMILLNINEKIQGEAKVDTSKTGNRIQDLGSISANRKNFVLQAYEKGLITGKPGVGFDGKGFTTRAEASTVIVRLLEKNYRQPVADAPVETSGREINLSDPNRNIRVREGDTVVMPNGTKVVVKMGKHYLGEGQGIDFYQNAIGYDGKTIKPGSLGISVYTHDMVSPEVIAKYEATGAELPETLNGVYIKLKNGDYMMSDVSDIIHTAYFMDLPNVSTQKIGAISPCGFYKVVPHQAGGGRGIWEMQL